jgi:glycosyltransferase involved in cell wall biosynthesis
MATHRVLFCTLGYEPGPVGGAERQARLQAEELVRRGHQVAVVTAAAPHTRSESIGGVMVHRLPRIQRRPFRTITYLPVLLVWLLLNIRRFDLVHVHLANLQVDVAAIAARLRHVPLYVKLAAGGPRGEIARMRKVSWVTRYIGVRSARFVQAISAEIAAEVAAIGIPEDRVLRIPNGLRTDVFHPIERAERSDLRRALDLPDEVLVLFAGRFARYKGILDLLEAWRQTTPTTQATLVVVGEPAIDAPVGRLPATPRTIIRPWTQDVSDYFKACDLYVHPSRSDGMPNVVLEAMACGRAVIATRIAAIPSMIRDGETGLLVEAGAVDEIRTAIETLVGDEPARERIGAAAAVSVAAAYPIQLVVDRIEAAYDSMLSR